MSFSPSSTSPSLILRVQQREQDAWGRLSGIYGPLVFQWCLRRGVSDASAADIVQEVLLAVSKSIDSYRRDNGRQPFRGWLYGISSNKINDHFRQQQKQNERQFGGDSELQRVPAEIESESVVREADDRLIVIRQTLQIIKNEFSDTHWQAFWRTSVDGQSAVEIGDELGLSPAAVRQAKCRVSRRLRAELADLEDFS